VDENAVASATDAFGLSIGNERIGLYSSSDIRGFSPIDAGNGRIEGLYFAQVEALPVRIVDSTAVRVGITAQGYPFPAPTGIVDYRLTLPGSARKLTGAVEHGQFGSIVLNTEAEAPLTDSLGIFGGGTVRWQNRHEGGNFKSHILAGSMAWRPSTHALVAAFASYNRTYEDEAAPSIFPGGDYLPPRIARRAMIGQSWAQRDNSHLVIGAVTRLALRGWQVEAGLFRAQRDVDAGFTDLFSQMRPNGTTPNRVIVADANNLDRTLSGELRLSRTFGDAGLAHKVALSLRGKRADRRFGGAQRITLGESTLLYADERPAPAFAFATDDQDGVEQATAGVAYSVAIPQRLSLDLALSQTHYRKEIAFAGGLSNAASEASPLTGSATGALTVLPGLTLFGGHVRGFEEVAAAPANASNRGAAPPAIRTVQSDLGLRVGLSRNLSLVTSAFTISKPYYNVDAAGIYRDLGSSASRGVEISLAGTLGPGISLVAGTVLMDATISGDMVESGLIGPRPVGSVRRRSIVNLDWRLDQGTSPLSFDIAVESLSARVGNASNRLFAPARQTLDIGMRYRFRVGRVQSLLRAQIANLFNAYGWNVAANGAFQYTHSRRFLAELSFEG
jgi:iron complex outermembrane receptor protein